MLKLIMAAIISAASFASATEVQIQDLEMLQEAGISMEELREIISSKDNVMDHPDWVTSGNHPDWLTDANHPDWLTDANHPDWVTDGSHPDWLTGSISAEFLQNLQEMPEPTLAN